MTKPGPRPNARCPKDVHFKPTESQRQILNSMGSGGVAAKLQTLIDREGLRQFPKDRQILKYRWLVSRKEAKEWAAVSKKYEDILSSEFGCTREELDDFEEDNNATN